MKAGILFLLCICWYGGAFSQQNKEAALKKMKQERLKLAAHLDSLKEKAVTYSIEMDSLNAIIDMTTKQLEAIQKNNVNDNTKGRLDSLTQQVAFLKNQLSIPTKRFDRILFRLDSCVSVQDSLENKIKRLQKTD